MYRDQYGRFEIQAEQEFNNKIYQWRKYDNNARIKALGGQYANYCEDGRIKFHRNEYIRDKTFSKFVDEGEKS
jgi:hypothetical protein